MFKPTTNLDLADLGALVLNYADGDDAAGAIVEAVLVSMGPAERTHALAALLVFLRDIIADEDATDRPAARAYLGALRAATA